MPLPIILAAPAINGAAVAAAAIGGAIVGAVAGSFKKSADMNKELDQQHAQKMKAIDTLSDNWKKAKTGNERDRLADKMVEVANSSPLANYESQKNK